MQEHIMRWIIPLIAGLIVVGIFLFWVFLQMQDLPIVQEGSGPKARFMRYLSCAMAMCSAWTDTDGDACHSGEVMSQPLEFEGGSVVKGCKELCEKLRDDPLRNNGVVRKHYCGENFAFEYIFDDYVNFTSLDIRNLYKFKNRVLHKGCYICAGVSEIEVQSLIPTGKTITFYQKWGGYLSEGYLMSGNNAGLDCNNIDYESYPGLIWIPYDFAVTNCKGVNNLNDMNTYSYCEFNAGDYFWIWGGPEPPHKEDYTVWLWVIDSCYFGKEYWCPHVFMYTDSPSNCP
jgi:hypothetical protein